MNKSGDAALNAVCPYFTMFPLAFPHSILKRHALADQNGVRPVLWPRHYGSGRENARSEGGWD